MLTEARLEEAPELDASFSAVNLRSAGLRVGVHRGRNVTSDFTLVARASPFLERCDRIGLTLVLDGRGRFDEKGRTGWLGPGDLVIDDQREGGTEAYAGADATWVVLEWRAAFAGPSFAGPFRIEAISARDRLRALELARAFEADPSPERGIAIVDLLRAVGLPFERLTAADLVHETDGTDQRLAESVLKSLSRLDRQPSVDEVAEALGWNVRTLHRRLERAADRYALPWAHWRSALHHARIAQAIRWLGARGATTELVARLTGYRSPTSLCHAFARAGLPSPGALAHAARRDALVAWAPAWPSRLGYTGSIDARPLGPRAGEP